ncbi:flagellar hook-basal body complex protein [Exilibacterium tricleocarpae]|uniref:Flagellar hook protein FlgE n=1 Tax=Exilibacterium tricleocarpae TaxID=2591008 RepID=A0A545U3Z5_9GAMM|nr:flagellar hook-basal body complex protein [Exilibacterium tricleocarpae]TQV84133.1 flagellar hook-basal body complex protein [Exilibacterium tricleocarpae]
MPFNTALSGIRAASSDLRITGNNIANASTTGFKASRAEFGDVYASTILGGGGNLIGSGVRIQDVAQQFTQGNISFTENELDLAVSGTGFFVVSNDGDRNYTRAGTFGLDEDGFVVNSVGARLQGFTADAAGNVGGILDDLRIDSGNQAPRQTTLVESALLLDSRESVLQSVGSTFATDGSTIGDAQTGLQTPVTTRVEGTSVPVAAGFDFTANAITFDVALSGASGNNGTVSVALDFNNGAPASLNTLADANAVAAAINAQLFAPLSGAQSPIDVVASVVNDGGGQFHIDLQALQDGEASTVSVTSGLNTGVIGLAGDPTDSSGTPAANNGYQATSLDFTGPDGNTVTYTSQQFGSAAQTASELNALAGISATASTTAVLRGQVSVPANPTDTGYVNQNGNLVINLNGVDLSSNSLLELEAEINALTTSTLPGISASFDAASGDLTVTSAVGDNLTFTISSTDDGDSIEVSGSGVATTEVLEADPGADGLSTVVSPGVQNLSAATGNAVVTGGSIDIVMDEGYSVANITPLGVLFNANFLANIQPAVINQFDPSDQSTYNHATSLTIFDSLGNPHVMTQYFVKQAYDPDDPTTSPNQWLMNVLIDGQNVGDPLPGETTPTLASFNVHFNQDGTLNRTLTDDMLISNWEPLDADGRPTGALGPQNVLSGGTLPIPTPSTSSNFQIDLTGSTQFGDDFSVDSVDQDGFTTGQLSGISIDDSGVVFARFSNGEAQIIAQIGLADFPNEQGLQQIGDTMWAENFDSGVPNISAPGTAALGAIQSGALEESNVDLSQQLVNLIIAQRNFQASAKTIETADQTTQTIINLR